VRTIFNVMKITTEDDLIPEFAGKYQITIDEIEKGMTK